MDDHEQLQNHEKRLTDSEGQIKNLNERTRALEENTDDIRHRMDELSDEVKKGNVANDKMNDVLAKQNNQMLSMLGGIQQEKAHAKTKEQEAHIASWQALAKLAIAVGAVAGIISTIINLFFH